MITLGGRVVFFAKGTASDPKDAVQVDEEAIPWDKQCQGCDATVAEVTFWEKTVGMKHRLWGLKQFWGSLCGHCVKMSRVRYGWMTVKKIVSWLEHPSHKQEFKNYSICYVSIRAEGRIHITPEMLENRLAVMLRCMALLNGEVWHHVMLLADHFKAHPNVDPRSLQLVQMEVDGALRLGVRVLQPAPTTGVMVESTLDIDSRLRCTHEGDLEILQHLEARHAALHFAASGGVDAPATDASADPAGEKQSTPVKQKPESARSRSPRTQASPSSAGGRGRGLLGRSGGRMTRRYFIKQTILRLCFYYIGFQLRFCFHDYAVYMFHDFAFTTLLSIQLRCGFVLFRFFKYSNLSKCHRPSVANFACADESLVAQEIVWPKSKHTTPMMKMESKLNSIYVALGTESWSDGLKDKSLKATERVAEQQKKDVKACEFQVLIETANLHVEKIEKLLTVGRCWKLYDGNATSENLVVLSNALVAVEDVMKTLTSGTLWCKLFILKVCIRIQKGLHVFLILDILVWSSLVFKSVMFFYLRKSSRFDKISNSTINTSSS